MNLLNGNKVFTYFGFVAKIQKAAAYIELLINNYK